MSRAATLVGLLLFALTSSSCAVEVGCPGPSPSCVLLYGECCSDSGYSATCMAGEWVCDPCVLGEEYCDEPPAFDGMCDKEVFDGPAMGISPNVYCNVEL